VRREQYEHVGSSGWSAKLERDRLVWKHYSFHTDRESHDKTEVRGFPVILRKLERLELTR